MASASEAKVRLSVLFVVTQRTPKGRSTEGPGTTFSLRPFRRRRCSRYAGGCNLGRNTPGLALLQCVQDAARDHAQFDRVAGKHGGDKLFHVMRSYAGTDGLGMNPSAAAQA